MDRQFGDNNLKVSVIMNYDFGFPSLIIRGCVWFGGVFGVWGGGWFFFSCYIVSVTVAAADFILHLLGKELTVCMWIARTAGEKFTLCFARCFFPSQLPCLYHF